MSGQGTSITEDIDASGMVGSSASEVVLAAATNAGLVVTATAPGQYQLTRTYRAGWVVPAAIVGVLFFGLGILLLFLVPKRTEICAVAINEQRRGVTVRLNGVAPAVFVDRVRRDLAAAGTTATVTAAPPPLVGAIAPMPSASASVSASTSAPVSPPEPDAHMTVLRGRVSNRHATDTGVGTHDAPAILVAGRLEPVGAGLVIGRNPAPPTQLSAARAVAITDGELSKTHLAIRWSGEHVEVCDLSSTNGTVITGIGAGSERRCDPGTWIPVPAGAHIRAGTQNIELR